MKSLLNWLVRERLASENPLGHISRLQVTDKVRKHVRRALEVDEVRRLLEATCIAPTRCGRSGLERYWLCRLAVETGLRSGERRALTGESFRLDTPEPTVWLSGDDTKNRRPAELPLWPETATALREFLAMKLPTGAVFHLPRPEQVVFMLRDDLCDAGIPYRDGADRVADFHSLRVAFCTLLAAAGVPIKTLQTLARHSDPRLTLNTYTRTVHGSLASAIQGLPDFEQPSRQTARATGTDCVSVSTGTRNGGKEYSRRCNGVPKRSRTKRPANATTTPKERWFTGNRGARLWTLKK